ncbi:AraC family transcriptional regulator [Enterococcus sp. RIT-PI-f]|uniref:AraC family transcriptional regulator n=1 Tax=Enterococcus sp. RIT-PI-f TaxID=1690244 RepID=UPI0006B93E72|nr:AraC family transcriptional regulator [Enterococcus sp. RIT-PI-f]KPG69646.1 AraC family transcriptional regulator [Enterococcus sp. RIT-PI-f]
MEWIQQLNTTIDYIEGHLNDEINYEALAKLADCSSFHYQRMFAYMAGVPLSEYIRRRRMTRAAIDLQNGDKVIDVALRYGYSSPTSFNRAFQSVHLIAPSLAKKKGVPLKSFPPIRFQISIKGAEEMKYRIEEKEAFQIVGRSIPLSKNIEENFNVVPKMWEQAASDGTLSTLMTYMNQQPMGVLGVSVCNHLEEWRYYIAVSSDITPLEDFESYQVPASIWAIFEGKGTGESIQELEKRIITEWLPSSGYEYGQAADIEVYLDPDPQNTTYEVWLPVEQKNRDETSLMDSDKTKEMS